MPLPRNFGARLVSQASDPPKAAICGKEKIP